MRLFAVLGLFVFVLTGCGGGGGDEKAPDIQPQTCLSGGCIEPPSITLRTKTGKEKIRLTDLTWVQVKVYKQIGPVVQIDLRREFIGDDAIKVVTQLGLDAPRENAPPLPGTSMTSGQISLNYKRATDVTVQSKTLLIQSKQIILDYEYDEITYDPRRTLDRAWLEKQPQ